MYETRSQAKVQEQDPNTVGEADGRDSGGQFSISEIISSLVNRFIIWISGSKPAETKEAKPIEHPLQQKIAVPRKLLEKQQSRPLLEELLRQCNYDLKMYPYDDTAPADHLIVVPCVNESRVGSDLGAAFQDADMDPATENRNVIVILFMPKAKHVPEHTVSTFEKMGDEFKVQDMVDVYFWDDDIYKCDTNDKARQQMKKILKGKDLRINPQQ